MGNDPQGSVVNRNCQLHDVDNVFVIDSSVHVTNGGFNPALTIMAIAYYRLRCIGPQLEGYGIPFMKRFLKVCGDRPSWLLALLAVGGTYGASYYYTSQHGQGCASCHEMAAYVSAVQAAPHRNGPAWIATRPALSTKLRHIRVHLFGNLPEAFGCETWMWSRWCPTARSATRTNMRHGMRARTAPAIARFLPIQCKTQSNA